MRSAGNFGTQVVPAEARDESANSLRPQPKERRSRRIFASTGASATSAARSMWAMRGSEKAKRSSRQVRVESQRATQAEAGDPHRAGVLRQQEAEQGPRIEQRLAQRLDAAHQVGRPVQLAAEERAARRAAPVIGRLDLDDLHVEPPRHARQQRDLLDVGLGLHVAVDVEEARPLARAGRPQAPRVHLVGLRILLRGSGGGTSAPAARAASGTPGPRSPGRAAASAPAPSPAAGAPARGKSSSTSSPR